METSPSVLKGYSTFSVVIESPFPKRQRTDSSSFESYEPIPEDHGAVQQSLIEPNTTPDPLTTKPASLSSEPVSPMPSVSTPSATTTTTPQPPKRRKTINSTRVVTTEVPQSLTETYTAQPGICLGIQKKHKGFTMCMACVNRQFNSGGCKFTWLRAFPIDPETKQFISLASTMFLNSAPFLGKKQREATRTDPIIYSTPGTSSDKDFIKSCIGPTLLSVLAMELVHEVIFRDAGLLQRRREAGVRPLCDGCSTTIFSGHFMCCCCGREICLDCYSEWDDSEEFGWENADLCTKRRRHTKRQMIPFTLFEQGELERLIKDVKAFPCGKMEPTYPKKFSQDKTDGFLPYTKVTVDEISDEDFQSLWGRGQPLVLTGCSERFQISWAPDHFIRNYGDAKCFLVNCESDKMISSTVGKFFNQFLSTDPKHPLKLKVLSIFKRQLTR
jgi:hypothetical protein